MKKALLLLLLASGLANAQSLQLQGGTGVPGSGYTNTIRNGAGAPGFLIGNNGDFYIDTTAHVLYGPKAAGVWPTPGISLGGGAGSPVWGGITGLLVNQTDLQSAIDAKQDVLTIGDLTEAVSSVLTITGGAGAVIGGPGVTVQAKQSGASQAGYLSSADWNTFNGKQASGSYLTALTGDASAAGPGSAALTLATVNGASGACGDSTHVCAVTTNAKGLVTVQAATAIAASGLNQLSGDITAGPGTGSQAASLATVNSGPGACGDATHVCQATTNGKGLVTSQSAVAIAIPSGAVSGLAASATTDATNASNISSGTLPAGRLPNPSASTLGGVESITATSHQWNDSISTSGVVHQSQPTLADIAAGVAPSGTFDFSGSTAVKQPSSAGAAPTTGGDIRFDSTQQATVAGGNGSVTGSFPRLIYWAHPSSDVICAHGGDATISLEFGASCNNNTGADATAFTTFTIQPPIPAGFMVKDKMLRVRYDMVLYTTALNTGLIFNLKTSWGATQIYTNSGSSISGSLPGASFLVDCMVTAHGAPATSASMSSSCSPEVPGYGISSMVNKTSVVPVVNTSAPEPLKFAVDWAATGLLSGTYTSGITATGTVGQTCNLATFNNGNSGGTATVALTGTNTIAASTPLVFTNTGGNSTSAATSATASNGTATCSGTATVATVLGGTQGVAVQLRGVTVEELN